MEKRPEASMNQYKKIEDGGSNQITFGNNP